MTSLQIGLRELLVIPFRLTELFWRELPKTHELVVQPGELVSIVLRWPFNRADY